MLISDLEQLEFLSERESVIGGSVEDLQLFLNDNLITLKLGDQPFLEQKLIDGKPLTSKFSVGKLSGSLTALQHKDGNNFSQLISLSSKTDTGNFAFSSSTLITSS